MREPLPGWMRMPDGHGKVCIGCVTLSAWPSGYWRTRGQWPDAKRSPTPDLRSAQLAAEDAARAIVSDMAAALGGSVTWPTEGGE
jgi:hypothetical protein